MESKNPTCEDRIESEKRSREASLKEIFAKMISSDYETNDEGYDELRDLALSIEEFTVIKCLLSTGGPADWLEIVVTDYKEEIVKVIYHFADWFDHAEMVVEEDSPLYEYAEQIVESRYN